MKLKAKELQPATNICTHEENRSRTCDYNVYVWSKQRIIKLCTGNHNMSKICGRNGKTTVFLTNRLGLQETILLQKNVTSQMNVPLGRTYVSCCHCVRVLLFSISFPC